MELVEQLVLDLSVSLDVHLFDSLESALSELGSATTEDLNYISSILLSSVTPKCLLGSIVDAGSADNDRAVTNCRVKGIKLISNYIKTIGADTVSAYAPQAITFSRELYRRDPSNEVKAAALGLLRNIFSLYSKDKLASSPEELEVTEMLQVFVESLQYGKLSKGSKCGLLKVLGLLVQNFWQISQQAVHIIVRSCKTILMENLKSTCKDPDLQGIAGALSSLDRIFVHFDHLLWSPLELLQYIAKVLSAISQEDITRFAVISKALRLLKNHAALFGDVIGLNVETLYRGLLACRASEKVAVKKHIDGAISAVLVEASNAAARSGEVTPFLKKIVQSDLDILDNGDSKSSELLFAVRCIADVSSSMKEEKLKVIDAVILAVRRQSVVEGTIKSGTNTDSALSTSSSQNLYFLYAVAKMIASSDVVINKSIYEYILQSSKDICLIFPNLYAKTQQLLQQTMCLVLYGCYRASASVLDRYQEDFLSFLFFRTVSRMEGISLKPTSAIVNSLTGQIDERCFPYYRSLWVNIISGTTKDIQSILFSYQCLDYGSQIGNKVYDQLMSSLLRFISSIDIAYTRNLDDSSELAYAPVNIADQELLLNAAYFLEAFLPSVATSYIEKWFSYLVETAIPKSRAHPAVSALYRILTVSLEVYIKTIGPSSPLLGSHNPSFAAIILFISDLNPRMGELEGELLESVLGLVFASASFLPFDQVVPGIRLALVTQLHALKAIQAVDMALADKSLDEYLPSILPLLEPFIVEESSEARNNASDKSVTSTKRKWVSTGTADDARAASISNAVIRLLGRLGGKNQFLLTDPRDALLSEVTASPSDVHLACVLTMPSTKKTDVNAITLDLSLVATRLMELLRGGGEGEGQLQSLAAECLHAVLIYMIGSSANIVARKNNISVMYERIIPTVVELSLSRSSVKRQLFEGLYFQTIRWFSGFNHVHEDDVEALLKALTDLACDSLDAAIRRVAVNGLEEFFKWSLKQASKKEIAAYPGSSHAFVVRLITLCSHASEAKRMAATELLRKICVHFREESSLVHKYVLQIVGELVKSLRLPASASLSTNCGECIERYADIITKSIRNMDDRFGLLASSVERAHPPSLPAFVESLWDNITDPCSFYRSTVMNLLERFIPIISKNINGSSIPAYFKEHVAPEEIIAKIEGDSLLAQPLQLYILDAAKCATWISQYNGAVHCYNWLFSINDEFLSLLDTNTTSSTNKKRKLGTTQTIQSRILACTRELGTELKVRSSRVQLASALKALGSSEFLLRILQFFNHVLYSPSLESFRSELWLHHGFKELFISALLPSSIEDSLSLFGLHDEKTTAQILLCCMNILKELSRVHSNIYYEFLSELKALVEDRLSAFSNIHSSHDAESINCLDRAVSHLRLAGLMESMWSTAELQQMGTQLVQCMLAISSNATHEQGATRRYEGLPALLGHVSCLPLQYLLQIVDSNQEGVSLIRSFPAIINQYNIQSENVFRSTVQELVAYVSQQERISEGIDLLVQVFLDSVQESKYFDPVKVLAVVDIMPTCPIVCEKHLPHLLQLRSQLTAQLAWSQLDEFALNHVCAVLKSTSASITDVIDIIPLVNYLLPGTSNTSKRPQYLFPEDPRVSDMIGEAFEELIAMRYPLNSRHLDPKSEQGKAFGLILAAHLRLIEDSGALCLIDQLISSLKEGDSHRFYSRICLSFRTLATNISEAASFISIVSVLKKAFSYIFLDKYSSNVRLFFREQVAVPLFESRSLPALQFVINTELTELSSDGSNVIKQLVAWLQAESRDAHVRASACILCKIVIDRLPVDVVKGAVTAAFTGKADCKGNELTTTLTKAAATEVSRDSSDFSVLKAAAFSLLALVISKTQTEEKFYDLVWSKTCWKGVIDSSRSYDFDETVVFESCLLGSADRSQFKPQTATDRFRRTVHDSLFSQSLLLSFSSLSQANPSGEGENSADEVINEPGWVRGLDDCLISLELSHLNTQPIMGDFLRCIQRLSELHAEGWAGRATPGVVVAIHKQLSDASSSRTTRLFFLRLVINQPCASVFRPYASLLTPPILECCLRDLCEASKTINYFIKDVLFLFCEHWAAVKAESEVFRFASALISSLFELHYKEGANYKTNAVALAAFVGFWLKQDSTHLLDLNLRSILSLATAEYASTGGAKGKATSEGSVSLQQRVGALTVLLELLTDDYAFNDSIDDTVAALLDCLKYPRKEVVALASRALGVHLSKLEQQAGRALAQRVEEVVTAKTVLKRGFDAAASCLYQISKGSSSFLTRDLFLRLKSGFSQMTSRGRLELLSCFHLSSTSFSDASVLQYLAQHIPSLLRDLYSGGKIQLLTLQVLNKYLADVPLSVLEMLQRSSSEDLRFVQLLIAPKTAREIREQAYELFMNLQNAGKGNFKHLLLQGLSDPDDEGMERDIDLDIDIEGINAAARVGIRKKIFNFFNRNLGQKPGERLISLMDLFGGIDNDDWISMSAYFLLRLSNETRDYESPIFSYDLGECAYQKLQISSSQAAARHPMTPSFSFDHTQSLLSQTQKTQWQSSQLADDLRTGIRDTQVYYKWTQTQAGASSQNLEPDVPMGPPRSLPSRFGGKRVISQQTIQRGSQSTPGYSDSARPRKAPKQVVMYRSYRTGELPDIKITLRDVVSPCAALSLLDKALACHVVAAFFGDVTKSDGQPGIIDKLVSGLETMLTKHSTGGHVGYLLLHLALGLVRSEKKALFSAATACSVGLRSLQHYGAIALIEEQLLYLDGADEDVAAAEGRNHWACLSVLYSSLGEHDVIYSIQSSCVSLANGPLVQRALDAELSGDYVAALGIYNDLFTQGKDDQSALALFDERSFECLRQLGEWNQLKDKVAESVELFNWESLVTNKQEKWIAHYTQSLAHISDTEDLAAFFSKLFGSDRNADARRWLEDNHPSVVALSHCSLKNWASVQKYTNKSLTKFRASWRRVHSLAFEAKKNLLQSVQVAAEMDEISKLTDHSSLAILNSYAERNSLSFPSMEDPLVVWYDIDCVRSSAVGDSLTRSTAEFLIKFRENTCYAALKQGVLYVVKEQLRRNKYLREQFGASPGSEIRDAEIVLFYNRNSIAKKLASGSPPDAVRDIFNGTLQFLEAKLNAAKTNPNNSDQFELELMRAQWLRDMTTPPSMFPGNDKILAAYHAYEAILGRNIEVVCKSTSSLYSDMAEFFDSMLSRGKLEGGISSESVAISFVTALNNGLLMSDKKCRGLVLRLVAFIGEYPRAAQYLKIESIPPWLFLAFSAQLISRLDKPEGQVVAAILERVADFYPFAVYYSLKISFDNLGEVGQRNARKLKDKLAIGSLDAFVEAIGGLNQPDLRFVSYLQSLQDAIKVSPVKFQDDLDSMRTYCFSLEWPHVGGMIGNMNVKFVKKFSKVSSLMKIFDSNNSMEEKLAALMESAKTIRSQSGQAGKLALGEMSTWLSAFDSGRHLIEIPGLYGGVRDREPDIAQHPYIVSFGRSLLVMESKQRPSRLIMIGSDGKEYPFLCKGGEDLRNDERIMSSLQLMNAIMSSRAEFQSHADATTAPNLQSQLHVYTYKVVPMTVRCGILEWVANTIPIKACIEEEIVRDDAFYQSLLAQEDIVEMVNNKPHIHFESMKAATTHTAFLGGDHSANNYHTMFKTKSQQAATKVFQQMLTVLPADLLRRRLLRMSSSAAMFITIRTEFSQTLAANSAFLYILGVGDRHLENILLDTRIGSLIHIDFGCCFNIGASVLPVPELIPFRLTRQFEVAMHPHSTKTGIFRHLLIKIFQRMQAIENARTLSQALEIYLNDPVVDWLKGTTKSSEGGDNAASAVVWEPLRRIQVANQKLSGESPIALMKQEIARNPRVLGQSSQQALCKILDNCGGTSTARGGRVDISSQVDELIAMATDPNILVRQWQGLTTWI